MAIVVIIDGTGTRDNKRYESEFAKSFCKQIEGLAQSQGHKAHYFRGPIGDNPEGWDWFLDLMSTAAGALWSVNESLARSAMITSGLVQERIIHTYSHAGPVRVLDNPTTEQIYLVGYSRGGLAAISIAEKLRSPPLGASVKAMFLFDAVNMTTRGIIDSSIQIPDNVGVCYHAHRSPLLALGYHELYKKREAELNKEMDGKPGFNLRNAFLPEEQMAIMSARRAYISADPEIKRLDRALEISRSDPTRKVYNWGNCGLEVENKTRTHMETRAFMGSHGAMGGVADPDSVIKEDFPTQIQIRQWMFRKMQVEGLIGVY